MAEPWKEYADLKLHYDILVDKNPSPETYYTRWRARTSHSTWTSKRDAFLWYTRSTCERCGFHQQPSKLQLHHRHYNTLWYENNRDLELLCPRCHQIADRERADQEARQHQRHCSLEERAHLYMQMANRWSGQDDWPVSYRDALKRVQELEED